jgi:hypothetical protein
MDNIWKANVSTNPPAQPSNPASGFPTESGTPTDVGAWWFHSITQEIRNVIAWGGLTPLFSNLTQLKDAIAAKIAGAVAAEAAIRATEDNNLQSQITANTNLLTRGVVFAAGSGSPTTVAGTAMASVTIPAGKGGVYLFSTSVLLETSGYIFGVNAASNSTVFEYLYISGGTSGPSRLTLTFVRTCVAGEVISVVMVGTGSVQCFGLKGVQIS